MTPQRRETLIQYGGACRCANGCKETRLDHLEIDHVDGHGGVHRRRIYPKKIEEVLEAAGYPEKIDGHRLTLYCQRCHRSKTKHGSCMIDHSLAPEDQEMPDDNSDTASMNGKGKKGSGKRELAATVQFSARVSEQLKARLDMWSNHGALTYPQTLERILDEIDADGANRHREVMAHLKDHQTILTNLGVQLTRIHTLLSDLALQGSDPHPRMETDPFAHRRPDYVPPAEIAPMPDTEPPTPRRWSPFRRRS